MITALKKDAQKSHTIFVSFFSYEVILSRVDRN